MQGAVAPRWHTGALIFLILAVAVMGVMFGGRVAGTSSETRAGSRITEVYLPILLVQWALVVYVARVGRPCNVLPLLLGRRWTTVRCATVDMALAALAGTFIIASELAWARLYGAGRNASVVALLPDTAAERFGWAVVATSVGFGEEIVYRGYLQAQLSAFTKSTILAAVLQATLFGIAHGEQGLAVAARFAVYGLALTGLARARGSLLPAIACHVAIDLAAGWMG